MYSLYPSQVICWVKHPSLHLHIGPVTNPNPGGLLRLNLRLLHWRRWGTPCWRYKGHKEYEEEHRGRILQQRGHSHECRSDRLLEGKVTKILHLNVSSIALDLLPNVAGYEERY